MAELLRAGEGRRLDFPGSTMVVKAGAGRAGGDFTLLEYTAEPGDGGPVPHTHLRHEELFFILEGSFEFLLDDESVVVHTGDFVRVPAGTRHAFKCMGDQPARWLGVASPAGIEDALADLRSLMQEGAPPEALIAAGHAYDTEFDRGER